MSLCKQINLLLVPYLDGELSKGKMDLVRTHLLDCQSCKKEEAKLQKIHDNLTQPDYQLSDSYSSELIVNINNKLDIQKSKKFKLVPSISLAMAVIIIIFVTVFKTDTAEIGNNNIDEYLLYKQYSGNSVYNELQILEESEEIATSLLPEEYIENSREYIAENSNINSTEYTEVFASMDDEDFNNIIEEMKKIEI